MKPLAYGYLRITQECDDEEIRQLERGLQKLAESEGFCLTETRYEYQTGYYGTFYRLTAELKRAQIHHVIVPSLDHLCAHPLLRAQLLMRLREANARVWTVKP
ncbi:MAG: recombinase family protein [Pseudonocardiaceae bacterium]